jgi:hypothetical protein
MSTVRFWLCMVVLFAAALPSHGEERAIRKMEEVTEHGRADLPIVATSDLICRWKNQSMTISLRTTCWDPQMVLFKHQQKITPELSLDFPSGLFASAADYFCPLIEKLPAEEKGKNILRLLPPEKREGILYDVLEAVNPSLPSYVIRFQRSKFPPKIQKVVLRWRIGPDRRIHSIVGEFTLPGYTDRPAETYTLETTCKYRTPKVGMARPPSDPPVFQIEPPHKSGHIALSPNGKWLASGSDQGVALWETSTWKQIAELPAGSVAALSFSPDSRLLGTYSSLERVFHVWEVAVNKAGPVFKTEGTTMPVFSADSKQVVTYDLHQGIEFWNIKTGNRTEVWKDQTFYSDLVFSPNGRWLAAIEVGRVTLWDIARKEKVRSLSTYTVTNT